MLTENSSAVNLLGARVLYVEPNDVSGSINGVPLTPDYSDYCISVNLIAEVYPRHRQSGIDGDVERKGDITATAVQFNVDENGKIVQNGKWVSFLRGDDAKKYTKKIDDDTNFLTTYYTDIDYQDLLKRNEVEGVGIESVNIAFESYYTPSITIKFIDVRGASLFGAEENRYNSVAGANSEVSKDIADNGSVFSAFFTIPYPKFRLQVKGYYGKAVTYQMTCKDFRASFNSQTGNFEATAQFLGYSYSLLTDIPMQFLIAAPYCEYAGRSYWNEHLNSPEWSMSDGTPPVRLKELFDDIRSAMENNEVNPGDIGAEFADKKNSLDEEKTVLGTIREDLDKLKSLFIYFNGGRNNAFKDRGCRVLAMSGEGTNNDKDVQFLVFTDKNDSAEESDTFEIEIKTLGDLCHTISSNCQSVPNVSCEGTTINDVKEDGKIAFKKICTIVRDGDGKITELAFVDGWDKNFGLNAKSIQKLREIADDENLLPEYSDELGEYIFVFSMGDVEEQVKNELSSCDSELIDINEKIEYKTNEYYAKVFNFRPCIGDVFKVVMCHLETFIHMMWVCYRKISGMMSQRTPQSLGVDISNTDISGAENQIYPWPGIFKHGGVSQQGGEEDSSVDVWEWMGNVAKEPDKYPEIKLVKNLFCSLRDVEKDNTMFNKTNILEAFPILPSDINNDNGIFDNCSDLQDTSSLAGYIGLRCAQVIGILAKSRTLSAEDCETYGIMDALNLYSKIGQTNIETLVKKTNCGESGYLAKLFKDIAQCNSSADSQGTGENQRHLFEVTPIVNGRQPIFNKDNRYIYFFTKGQKIGLVPDHFVAWKSFNVDFHKGQDEQRRGYFNPFSNDMEKDEYGNVILKNLLVNCTTGKLIEACGSEQSKTAILNPNMFDVVTDSSIVNTVMNRYEELISSGTVSVNDNEFTIRKESIENCLYGGNEIYAAYFRDRSPFLSKSLDKKQKEEIDKIKSGIFSNYDKWWNSKNTGKLIYPDGENDGEVDGATVRMLWWKNSLHGVGSSYTNCLFADPFYYLQNEIKDEDVKRYVKAYLFLQCFKYKTESSVFNDDYFDFVTGINVVPFGIVLKLGAEYWRERYYRSNSKDPINYGDGKVYTREIKRVASDFYNRLDECIKNRLILEFKRFADTVFPEICSNLELTTGVAAPFEFTYDTFSKFLTEFKGDRFVLDRNSVIDSYIYGGCKGFYELYDNISFDARTTGFNEVRILINQGKKNLIGAIKDIYCRKVLVNMIFRNNSNYYDGTVTVDEGLYTSYLKGFEQTVNTLASKQPVPVSNEGFTNNIDMDSDTLLSIYMYVKNLWDRWLVTTPNKGTEITYDHYYDVKNFFSNFVFIDSFYKNIYSKFLINCETMYNSYLGRANESSIYQFIGDILQQHKCMFLALPDYIALGDNKNGVKAMEDMFKPVPYNSMSNVEADNKFVVIYLPRCSEVPTSNNGYRQDNYNFYDPSKRVENGIPNSNCTADSMPVTYKTSPINDGDNEATRYGYYVPSFGVAFSRQNNQIFKNISLDMSTPLITSAAAAALTRISQSVANNDRKLTLMGQDVYPVFSNYSYQCEVEMMGNAQIQPLMYFQLMNIPMWNGVYMIFNVTHSITSGNFSTRFKGMKLSKNALPYNKSWFRLNNNQSDLHGGSDGGSNWGGEDLSYIADGEVSTHGDFEIRYETNISNSISPVKKGNAYFFDGKNDYMPPYTVKWTSSQTIFEYQFGKGKYNSGRQYFIVRCMKELIELRKQVVGDGIAVNQAAAVVGNMMSEGLPGFAQAWQIDKSASGKEGYSFGLTQMRIPTNGGPYTKIGEKYEVKNDGGGRFKQYREYCQNNNLPWKQVSPQIRYINDIVLNKEKLFNRLNSIEECVDAFVTKYEVPAGINDYRRQGILNERIKNANEAVKIYKANLKNTTVSPSSTGNGKPVLVGDSWAVGMRSRFKGETVAKVGATINVVAKMLEEYMRTNKPKYIVAYCGLNNWGNDENTILSQYKGLIQKANGYPIYIALLMPVKSPRVNNNGTVRKMNAQIIKACKEYGNSVVVKHKYVDVNPDNYSFDKEGLHTGEVGNVIDAIMATISSMGTA